MYIRTKFTKITIKIKIKIFCTFISLSRHSVDYLNLNKNLTFTRSHIKFMAKIQNQLL